MAASGMRRRAHLRDLEVIWRCCSGRERTAASGMQTRAHLRDLEVIWGCCSGRERTAASGMRRRAVERHGQVIWRCCSGREQTDVRSDMRAFLERTLNQRARKNQHCNFRAECQNAKLLISMFTDLRYSFDICTGARPQRAALLHPHAPCRYFDNGIRPYARCHRSEHARVLCGRPASTARGWCDAAARGDDDRI